jgi:hypothetical protein
VRPLTTISARLTVTAATLALATLGACRGDRATSPGPIGGPTTTVEVAYCTALQPTWVAFQDGNGAWTPAQPVIAGNKVTFQHEFSTDHGAIATVRTLQPDVTSLSVQYGLVAELTLFGDTNPSHCGADIPKTLLGTVAGLDTNDFAAVNAGFGSREIVGPLRGTGNNRFSLDALIPGPQDILATRTTLAVNGISTLTGIILRRTPDLPDGTTLPPLDFTSAEAFAPAIANVTINGLGAEGATVVTRLRTAHGENEISSLSNSETAATRTFHAIPEARLEPGDLQSAIATTNPSSHQAGRMAITYFHAPVDQTLTLGAPVVVPALSTVATTPSLRLRAKFDSQQDYDRTAAITYQQGQHSVSVVMTAAYAALDPAGYDLIVPDLSTVAGFDARWPLRAGQSVFWMAIRGGGTLGLGFNTVPTNGTTVRSGFAFDNFVP